MQQNSTFYHTLSNGIRIVHRQTASPVAYIGITIGAGTRDEMPKDNGLAHYIEHTVFKGTQKRSAMQIINRIENIGGDINANTTKEETTFYAAILSTYFARTLELLADMVFRPAFPEKELRKELDVIREEIESYNDSPSELIYDDFENLIFSGNTLQMPILGTSRTLRYLNRKKALDFMQRTYNTDQIVFFSYSDLPFDKVVRYAEKYLTDAPYHTRDYHRETPAEYTPQTAEFHKHTHQTHVMLGARAYPLGHEKQLALYLLNNILGGSGMNSLLNLSLRKRRGLVYTIESNYTPLSDTGYWAVYFAAEEQHTGQCLDLIYKQLGFLREKPLSPTAFRKYLCQLRGQMAITAENPENEALAMAKQMLYYNEAPTWQETYERIACLTPDDLHNVANEVFGEDKISTLLYR